MGCNEFLFLKNVVKRMHDLVFNFETTFVKCFCPSNEVEPFTDTNNILHGTWVRILSKHALLKECLYKARKVQFLYAYRVYSQIYLFSGLIKVQSKYIICLTGQLNTECSAT